MVGLHKSIQLAFLIAGHTKFALDWCFRLLKQKFRKTSVSCLKDIQDVVNTSAVVNTSQLVGDQSGHVIVPTFDWASYLGERFKRIPAIKAQHHFYCSQIKPGAVAVKQFVDFIDLVHAIQLDKNWIPRASDLPPLVVPKGLTLERKRYLYQKIREYCSPDTKDLVCPYPGPGPCPPSPHPAGPCLPSPHLAGPCPSPIVSGNKHRLCRQCGEEGHNSRTCKKSKV